MTPGFLLVTCHCHILFFFLFSLVSFQQFFLNISGNLLIIEEFHGIHGPAAC